MVKEGSDALFVQKALPLIDWDNVMSDDEDDNDSDDEGGSKNAGGSQKGAATKKKTSAKKKKKKPMTLQQAKEQAQVCTSRYTCIVSFILHTHASFPKFLQKVMEHEAFKADPFAALEVHIDNCFQSGVLLQHTKPT
jgi:hypothetical protein